jgi:hypothetical protein
MRGKRKRTTGKKDWDNLKKRRCFASGAASSSCLYLGRLDEKKGKKRGK